VTVFALLVGRIVRFAVRLVRPGGGSALPGLVVSKIAPNLAYKTLAKFPLGIAIVTGTAGKSTTTKMVVAICRAHGFKVFTNPSTANIEQGFFSTIVKSGSLTGRVEGEIAILEMDEAHAASFSERIKPRYSAVLNVFEDQLDRFVDPKLVREKLVQVARRTTGSVVLNADDPNLNNLVDLAAKTTWFGLDSKLPKLDYAKTFEPEAHRPKVSFEALELSDRKLKVQTIFGDTEFSLPSRGVHFAQDAVAALALASEILGNKFDLKLASKILDEIPPVFSRGETKIINGQEVEFILVQNPISFELNVANLPKDVGPIFLAIGRDVHDPSWMWTVDLSPLKKVDLVSGFNYADAALLLEYRNIPVERVEPDYFKAIDDFMEMNHKGNGKKTVLYSADAMRRLRRYLGFTNPEDVSRV